ncbi:hypothetical protein BASA81_014863 [Batrachochytrium salamandrivorans]|nr:hypothetical protein BASA81_014863 [Batrachochytrium salamandrivorans]
MNLASTIDQVGDGMYFFLEDVERAKHNIGGRVGEMVAMYLRKATYVNSALGRWAETSIPGILLTIESYWREEKYSKIKSQLKNDSNGLTIRFNTAVNAITNCIANIAKDFGSVIDNFQNIGESVKRALLSRTSFLWELRNLLRRQHNDTLEECLMNAIRSVGRFASGQLQLYAEIIKELKAAPLNSYSHQCEQQQTSCYRHIVRNTRLWAISETCITSSNSLHCPWIRCHPASQPRDLDVEESPSASQSCLVAHEHGSAVGTMILAKVPNFTPECLWIVGSVYVGHSGATTNYSRREALLVFRQSLDRVVPFDNNHPVLIFGDWNTDPQRLPAHCPLVGSWS